MIYSVLCYKLINTETQMSELVIKHQGIKAETNLTFEAKINYLHGTKLSFSVTFYSVAENR